MEIEQIRLRRDLELDNDYMIVRTVRRWEKGERYPGPQEMQALAQSLGVRIRDLVTFPEYPDI